MVEVTEAAKRKKKNKWTVKSLCDNIKCVQTFTLSVKSVPDGKEREKGAENIFEDL